MAQVHTITAIYDGEVLRPESPLDLQVNARYHLTIAPMEQSIPMDQEETGQTVWDMLDELAGTVEAPPDWAAEHDHYLYGTPKRRPKPEE